MKTQKAKILLALIIFFTTGCTFSQNDEVTTPSGLKYVIIHKGTGNKPEIGKEVIVNYTGWLTDGKKFDSSLDRKDPFSFVYGQDKVIKGWEEGLLLMKEGDKFRFTIPPELAYGSAGAGNAIPPNATLIFEIELLTVQEPRVSVSKEMYNLMGIESVSAAIKLYNDIKARNDKKYKVDEGEINQLGYILLQENRIDEAIEIFKLNVSEHPLSFNVYDSLGEAYMKKGDKENAVINYKKSLEINPGNINGEEMLKQLEGEK